jgi:hypothetical protein
MINKDTRFQQGGHYFTPTKTLVRESFSQYYAEVIIETITPLSPLDPIMVGQVSYLVRDVNRTAGGVQSVLMPESWAKNGSLADSYSNQVSASKFLSVFGLQSEGSTSPVNITIPSTSVSHAIDYVRDWGISGGQGLFATMDGTGSVKILNPQAILNVKEAPELLGHTLEQSYSLEWVHLTPGLVYLLFYSDKGIEEEVLRVTPAKHTVPIVHNFYSCFIDNPSQKETIRARFRNAYWYNYYNSQRIKVEKTNPLGIGSAVTYQGGTFIVWESEISYTGGSIDCNLLIVRGP